MRTFAPDSLLPRLRNSLDQRLRGVARLPNMERTGAMVGLLLLLVVFSIFSTTFRQLDNLVFLAKNTAITVGIVAVGQTVVLISGGIDLSVGSLIAVTGLISAWLMKYGLGPIPPLTGNLCYVAIGIGWLAGMLIGAAQGWLITYRQMPAFIVTLGTMVSFHGLSLALSTGAIIYGLPNEFKWFSNGHIGRIPAPVVIMLVLYIFTAYVLKRTKIGRYCFAIGGNETAARLSGINVNRYRILFYAYSGLLAALTGTILISYIDAAVYSNGEGFQFNSVAAAIIGGTSLTGGTGGIWGTLIGSFILAIIPSGMIMLNAAAWWQDVITGAIIVLAVVIDVGRQRSRKKAIRIEASQSIPAGRYLHELLFRLSANIAKFTGSSLCRVYLVDRETGDLVPQEMLSNKAGAEQPVMLGKSRIAEEVKDTNTSVLIEDLSRVGYQRVMLMHPEVQSALAMPLIHKERCVGVIELQSPGIAVFNEETVDLLETLAQPLVVRLEDAWLLESGWVVRQTRDAMRHLWDDLYLGRLPLADWLLQDRDGRTDQTAGARGEELRELLVQTVESLKPQEAHDAARGLRTYRILQSMYIQELPVDQILSDLHISRRQYYYDLKDSIEILSDLLVRNHWKAPE